jgi:hypothetical protein
VETNTFQGVNSRSLNDRYARAIGGEETSFLANLAKPCNPAQYERFTLRACTLIARSASVS